MAHNNKYIIKFCVFIIVSICLLTRENFKIINHSFAQTSDQNSLASIMKDMAQNIVSIYGEAGVEKIESKIFEGVARVMLEKGLIKITERSLDIAVVNLSREIMDGVQRSIQKKVGSGLIVGLTTDIILGAFTDFCADKVKDFWLSQSDKIGKRAAIIGAATSWVAIEQAYNIASSGNSYEVIASQASLILRIWMKDLEAMQEFADTSRDAEKSKINQKIMEIYASYAVELYEQLSPALRMLSMLQLKAKLDAIKDSYEQPYYGYAYGIITNIMQNIYDFESLQPDSIIVKNPKQPPPCGTASCPTDPTKPTPETPQPQTIYDFRGFFTGKLSGAQSFVGRRMEWVGGNTTQTLSPGATGNLGPVPGVNWQWYSYFNGDRGTTPTYSGNIPISITSSSNREGTLATNHPANGQTYNYLYFGEYAGGVTVSGDNYNRTIERGNWIIGRQTDPANVPTSGSATYQGGLSGVATNGETISGRMNLDMTFGSQQLRGWMHFRRQDGSRWGVATFSSVAVSNGRFNGSGTFQSYLNPTNPNGQSSIYGSFYGPQAQEIGGGWNLWNTGDALNGAMGIYRGRNGFTTETAPTPPDPPPPPISHTGDVAIKFPGQSLAATGTASIASLDGSELLANGRKAITLNNATVNVTVNDASRLGDDGRAYSHTAWGSWGSADYVRGDLTQPQAERGFYVYGRPTLNDEMPRSGTASYSGDVRGVAFDGQTIGGTATFTARFGVPGSTPGSTSSIDGSLALRLANNQPWVTLSSTNMSVHGNRFLGAATVREAGTAPGPGQTTAFGAINGGFYGNAAQEVAGQFYVSGASGPGGADGVFRARR